MGARYLGTVDGNTTGMHQSLPVANGVTVTEGDFVYFASGRVTSATIANTRPVGVAKETATGNVAGTVRVLVSAEPNARYLVKANATLSAANVGRYFDLTGATGAQLVDNASVSSTDGSLYLVEVNPRIEPIQGDATYGVFTIAQHAFENGA